jgi:hypothetical protein
MCIRDRNRIYGNPGNKPDFVSCFISYVFLPDREKIAALIGDPPGKTSF